MGIKPLKRENLYQKVVHQLMELIDRKQLIPGEKLPCEEELSKAFGVSRSIIRESLKGLELLDIIKTESGVGTFIKKDALKSIGQFELTKMIRDRKNSIDLMEIRCVIEKEAAFYAAKRRTQKQVKELEKIINQTKTLLLDRKYDFKIGLAFHMKIAELSDNGILEKMLNNISDELAAQRKELLFKHFKIDELMYELKEHIQIYNYIKDGNPYKARESMNTHLSRALKILRENE